MSDEVAARRARDRLLTELAGRADVNGVGLVREEDGFAVQVGLVRAGVAVPAEVDGVPVRTRVVGELRADGSWPRSP